MDVKCVVHGSLNHNYNDLKQVIDLFSKNGIDVIAPKLGEITGNTDGFVHMSTDTTNDKRLTELQYLDNINKLDKNSFCYYVNINEGLIGTTTSYELGIVQMFGIRQLFMKPVRDHPIYVPKNSVWEPEKLVDYIKTNGKIPNPVFDNKDNQIIKFLFRIQETKIAVGAIIVDNSKNYGREENEILLVKTHKWNNTYSIIGEEIGRNESIKTALQKAIFNQTGIESTINKDICTFNELSGPYHKIIKPRVFIDKIALAKNKSIKINPEEYESFMWIQPSLALTNLNIEPNARKTIIDYINLR
jgi:hypothetical protein